MGGRTAAIGLRTPVTTAAIVLRTPVTILLGCAGSWEWPWGRRVVFGMGILIFFLAGSANFFFGWCG